MKQAYREKSLQSCLTNENPTEATSENWFLLWANFIWAISGKNEVLLDC